MLHHPKSRRMQHLSMIRTRYRTLVAFCSALALISYYLMIASSPKNSGLPPSTVVVVLGEQLLPDASPSQNLKSRVATARNLVLLEDHDNYSIEHVIFSGGDTAQVKRNEATVINDLWKEETSNNTDESTERRPITVHLETESLSTCQNAFYSIPILKQIQAKQIVIVTSDYHAARAKLLFEQVFVTEKIHIQVSVQGAPTTITDRERLFQNERRFLEPNLLQILLTNMTEHPFDLPDNKRIEEAREELTYFQDKS